MNTVAKQYVPVKGGFFQRMAERRLTKTKRLPAKEIKEFVDTSLKVPNKVISEVELHDSSFRSTAITYILAGRDSNVVVVSFQKHNNINKAFIKNIVLSIYFNGVYKEIITPSQALQFNFVGRAIELSPPCNWMVPHSLQCNAGQINWSIHNTLALAQEARDLQLKGNNLKRINILTMDTIDVVFEGTKTRATRVICKPASVAFMPPGNDVLVVYYIATEVRGKYVHCVLSYFKDQATKEGKPPTFIAQIMHVPSSAYIAPDSSSPSTTYTDEGIAFTLQVGAWVPVGKLRNTLSTSPAIQFLFGLPITQHLRVDLGTSIFIPANAKQFNYQLPDTVLLAKPAQACGVLGAWVTHTNSIKPRYYLDKIAGIGVGFIQTDKTIEKPKDKNHPNHSIETVNISAGLSARKIVAGSRSVGINVTYNFTPYSLFQKHVDAGFGNQSVLAGLVYKF
jgi:hypothetical protein